VLPTVAQRRPFRDLGYGARWSISGGSPSLVTYPEQMEYPISGGDPQDEAPQTPPPKESAEEA
jgi:hypothetical protein